jgi:lipid II:glycine glycyltransferase (peptidoglycan interpeptide bridge formation enzyme)
MEIEIVKGQAPTNWDSFLNIAGPETNLLQSSYWASIINKLDSAIPYFIIKKNSSTIGQALILKRYPFNRAKNKRVFPLPYLECYDGPVISEQTTAPYFIEEIIKTALNLARHSFATHIVFTPAHTSRWTSDEAIGQLYSKYGFLVSKLGSYLVNVTMSEEDLFKSFKPAARKCIKKCHRLDLQVTKMRTFEEFKTMYWKTYMNSERYFERKAKTCSSIPWEEDWEGYYHYYVVKDSNKNEILACLGMYIFNGVATEVASSISPVAYQNKLPAQDLLHWKMMLEAKRMGCHTFDLAGVNPSPVTPKEIGIRRFKEKWGGRYVEYNRYKKDLWPAHFQKVARFCYQKTKSVVFVISKIKV